MTSRADLVEHTEDDAVGLYTVHDAIAGGGMGIVHLGRRHGAGGFARTVAIKRLHPSVAHDAEVVAMLVDEARLAARIHHPNVVSTLDVVAESREVLVVMEFVDGESLSFLMKAARAANVRVPVSIASAILGGVLRGLHAAHEARDERGEPLALVHRDVSPQNIIVGADGVARLGDFGVAKAAGRLRTTRDGAIRGKLGYMAPEHLRGERVTRQSDIYSAAVVAWELLTGVRFFDGAIDPFERVREQANEPPSARGAESSGALDDVVLRGLARAPADRFATAREMADALESAVAPASPSEVALLVERLAGDKLRRRRHAVAVMERAAPPSSSARALPVPEPADETASQVSETASQVSLAGAAKRSVVDASWSRAQRVFAISASIVLVSIVAGALASRIASGTARVAERREEGAAAAMTGRSDESDPPLAPAIPPEAVVDDETIPADAIRSDDPAVAARPYGAVGARPRAPSLAASASARTCKPPFKLDPSGRRVYKRECF